MSIIDSISTSAIIEALIRTLTIPCPDCAGATDDPNFFCVTCNCEGGDGGINVVNYLREHPEIIIYKGLNK
jgi:hypothetical protein